METTTTILERVRLALRLRTNDLDSEIQDLIDACKADLKLSGILNINEDDPLIIRAIVLYAKAHYKLTDENQGFQRQYDSLKCSILLSPIYTQVVEKP